MADDADLPGVPHFWAVVPAGGSGTRLWPMSRRDHPKFLLDVSGHGSSLLADTVSRLRPLCGGRVKVVAGEQHAPSVLHALPDLSDDQLILEPCPRDSLPAIGLAAAHLELDHPEAVLGSFAADHVVGDQALFEAAVTRAVALADDGLLVTLGIRPHRPATGFGYIRPGQALAPPLQTAPTARLAVEFVEKPDEHLATRYVREGYLWNAGMFVVRAGVLMTLIERWHPGLATDLRAIAADPASIGETWPRVDPMSIDRAIAEPAARAGVVAVVQADFAWDDIGDFAALSEHLPASAQQPRVRVGGEPARVLAPGTSGVVIAAGAREVVALGLNDIVIVDTEDALLVTTREHVQDVKGVVRALQERGLGELT
ncbi:MAG: sugar phosphate nucleotidyltransferase [Ornithinimicrobium sp.]